MKFSEVIGQEEAKQRMLQMVREGRVPQAMLLCGPQGAGKMAIALAMASFLLCSRHNDMDDACGQCRQCLMVNKWEHPDLHFTFPVIKLPGWSADHKVVSDDFIKEWRAILAKGPYFTMDQWLEQMKATSQQPVIYAAESDDLSRKLSLKSSQGGYKISIIWLPERMHPSCANKMLKLLEEPPKDTVFFMVSEQPEKLLDTIRSRAQRIDIRKIDNASVEKALEERRGIDKDTATRIARVANGNWDKALEELDANNENRAFFDMFVLFMRLAYMRNIRELRKWSEVAGGYGREKQKRMLTYFQRMIRENFMRNFGMEELCYMTKEEEEFSKKFSRFINEANVLEINDLLQLSQRDIGQNANGKIVFFDLALKMIMLLIQK